MALLALVLFAAAFFPVMANDTATKRNYKDELCTAMWQSCNSKCSNRCIKNGSNMTIWFKETKREYNVILVKSNHTECQASLLEDKKVQRITEQFNASSFKQCNVTKEVHVEIRVVQENKVSREGRKQETSHRFKKGFEIIVKGPDCSEGQCNVFIMIRRKENGSISAHACLMMGSECRTKQDICKCSEETVFTKPELEADNESNFNYNSRLAPEISEEEGTGKKTVKHSNKTICFVLLCLLLEILVYVVFHVSLGKKCRRTGTYDLENATSNPFYQQGLELPLVFDTSECQDPVSDQESYQPLVANTRVPGVRTQYGDLTEEREKYHPISPVDPASYQDLFQDRKDGNLNLEGLTPGEENGEPLYCFPEESGPTEEDPRGPRQRSNSSGCSPDPLYNVLKELKGVVKPNRAPSSDSLGEPIYYVLEEPVPIKEDPGSPRQPSDSSRSPRDPMYNVLKELQKVTNPIRAPSSDSLGEPIYYVLENPEDMKGRNTQDENL